MALITLVIGDRASGKTKKMSDHLHSEITKGWCKNVVLDINSEVCYKKIKTLHLTKLSSFYDDRKYPDNVVRVTPSYRQQTQKALVKIVTKILESSTDGIVILEDFLRYGNEKLIEKILSCSDNVVVVIILHTIQSCPKELLKRVTTIKLLRTRDSTLNWLSEQNPIIAVAQYLVRLKEPYFSVDIDLRNKKLYGSFSREDYRTACLDYLINRHKLDFF